MTEITTREQFEALPVNTVGTTRDGELWLKTFHDEWMKIASTRMFEDGEVCRIYGLPFRVIGSTDSAAPTQTDRQPGPYDDMGQLADAVHHVYLNRGGEPRSAPEIAWINRNDLLSSLLSAGVRLGTYDMHLIDELGKLKPEAVAALCGWIKRARLDLLNQTIGEAHGADMQLFEARLAMTRCVHDGCVESGVKPVGESYVCELHKTTTEGN